jgi:hypothetical protein
MTLRDGIEKTYQWIYSQVVKAAGSSASRAGIGSL